MGGGVPLSVIAGRDKIMEQMFTGGVDFGGTFNGNPFSLAAADVCLADSRGTTGPRSHTPNAWERS